MKHNHNQRVCKKSAFVVVVVVVRLTKEEKVELASSP